MNKIILLGRLTKIPEIRYSQNTNTKIALFTLAVNRKFAKQGEERETDFINIVSYSKLADFSEKYLSQGTQICVVGRLQNRIYEDKSGNKKYIMEVISEELGRDLKEVTLDMLGQAESVKVTKENTTIVNGKGEKSLIKERINQIKTQIEETSSEFDKEKLQERLAKLSGGVAVIKVGAATETELKERKLRIEDALAATKAAVEEGIVPGGGTAYVNAINKVAELTSEVDDTQVGINIIVKALEEPMRQIAINAGLEGSVIIEKVKYSEAGIGYDALNDKYVNMLQAGIVDPTKVTRSALQNAASVASTFLTTEAAVVDIPQKEAPAPAPGMGMDGMY